MSLNGIFNNGLSGLQAAQAGLRVVSQNIANVNTQGYARTDLLQQSQPLGAEAGGVTIAGYQRAVDQFLAAAALSAAATQGAAGARADLLNRAQQAFGDPTADGSLFAALDQTFAQFSQVAADPTNTLRRSNAIGAIQNFLTTLSGVSQQLDGLRTETEDRLNEQAKSASTLLSRIADLNDQIVQTKSTGGDATAAENAQSQLIDQLSAYVDVRITARDAGGVNVRTGAGALLVGDSAASITYTPASSPYGAPGTLSLVDANGAAHPLEGLVRGGSIAGLIQARDGDLPALSDALGALAGATADALNAAHNDSTSVPAPTSLTGRDTGLLSTDGVGFSGAAVIGVTDASGALVRRVNVDFSAGSYSVDGGAAVSFGGAGATVAQFVAGLNAALGGVGSASFTNGVLTIAGSGGDGVVVQQDPASPANRGGRGFSQFFGLNDLITRNQPIFFDTGFVAGDANGLNAGGALSFDVRDATGRVVLSRSVGVSGATWATQIAALNAAGTGIGGYGAFALDANGKLSVTPGSGYSVTITGDTTQRGGTGLSMSQLFGLDRFSDAGRASDLALAPGVAADPARLALARPDLTAAIGAQILETGDGAGAAALAAAASRTITFPAAGALAGQTTTLSTYASRLGGEAGRRASDASAAKDSATAVASAATQQRSSVEGVKLDDELVKMTQYQQSYAASSRLIQAAKDMFDILLAIK